MCIVRISVSQYFVWGSGTSVKSVGSFKYITESKPLVSNTNGWCWDPKRNGSWGFMDEVHICWSKEPERKKWRGFLELQLGWCFEYLLDYYYYCYYYYYYYTTWEINFYFVPRDYILSLRKLVFRRCFLEPWVLVRILEANFT